MYRLLGSICRDFRHTLYNVAQINPCKGEDRNIEKRSDDCYPLAYQWKSQLMSFLLRYPLLDVF